MIPELANLPSAGLLANPESMCWQKRPALRFSLALASREPEQVLQPDNTTEALVRILRRPQQEAAAGAEGKNKKKGAAGAATQGSGKGVKRAAEPSSGEQQGAAAGGAQKKLAVSANLLAGVAAAQAVAPAAAGGASTSGQNAGAGSDYKRVAFSQDELKAKTVKELQDALKQRGMPISGKKEVLMQRILEFQRRQKLAAMGPGA